MQTRINPQQVSHIQIYDAHKGYRWSNCIQEFQYKTFKKYWLFRTNPDGYYNAKGWGNYFKELPKGCYDLLGELYSYAKAEIFVGEKRIKTEYFESTEQAKEYCSNNFKEVNVIS